MQGMGEGVCKRGLTKKQWLDNITEWTKININYMLNVVHDRDGWRNVFQSQVYTYMYILHMLIPPKISESQD